MSAKIENLEHSMAKMTVEVSAEDFGKAIVKAYNKNKKNIQLPGFRKGKAPLVMIERIYGPEVFYEDAANYCINDTYPAEADASGLEITSQPVFDVVQMEKGKEFIYTAEFAVCPEVKLGSYHAIEVKKIDVSVSDEDVEKELKSEQEKNSRLVEVTDRPVEDGDTVKLDYAGTIDGVAFDGGTAEDQSLVIGSASFIPGFEEQLIGVSIGEDKDVEVTFPEDYHAKELAGKAAVFACHVKGIQKKELPELDDEFAGDAGFDTLDEYKEDLRKKVAERKEAEKKQAYENEAVDKLIEASEMDIADAMISFQAEQIFEDYARQLQSQGIPVDMFLNYQGMNKEKFLEQVRPEAERRVKTRLCLEELAKAENIEISEEKLSEELDKMAEQYKMKREDLEMAMGDYAKEQLKKDMEVQEAITFLVDNSVEVE
ncbi:MAG: trigger factor [Lachnospiraceae bacterium]|nr:trigger factor [Lachnospiraceae bacterium]